MEHAGHLCPALEDMAIHWLLTSFLLVLSVLRPACLHCLAPSIGRERHLPMKVDLLSICPSFMHTVSSFRPAIQLVTQYCHFAMTSPHCLMSCLNGAIRRRPPLLVPAAVTQPPAQLVIVLHAQGVQTCRRCPLPPSLLRARSSPKQ